MMRDVPSDAPTTPPMTPAQARAQAQAPPTPANRVRIDVAAHTDKGRVRQNNEDSYVIYRLGRFLEPVGSNIAPAQLPPAAQDVGYLMIVADGLGGHEGGEIASRTALVTSLELILRSPQWALKFDDPRTREAEIQAMRDRSRAYLAGVHDTILRQAQQRPELKGMGTTLTGAWSVGLDLFALHVGDSRAYLLRNDRLRKVTHDHTVAQDYADQGLIEQHEVDKHRMSHVLTRAVGGHGEDVEADMHHVRLTPGDRLLLCSDGLTDMVTELEIMQVLRSGQPSERIARALVDLANDHGGRDNITAIVAGYAVE